MEGTCSSTACRGSSRSRRTRWPPSTPASTAWRREVGVRFDHPDAIALLPRGGAERRGRRRALRPRLPPRAACAQAPAQFAMRARNPARDLDHRRRPHDLRPRAGPAVRAHGRRAARRHDGRPRGAAEADPAERRPRHAGPQHPASPNDVPLDIRHLLRALAADPADRSRLGRRAVVADSRPRTACASSRSCSAAARRSRRRPSCSPTATSTRRCTFDGRMLEGMLTYAAAGQAVIITPFLLMGAMAPVDDRRRARAADRRGAGRRSR